MAHDIKLDEYGDLDLVTGDFELVADEAEVAQLVETKILKISDEDFLALDTGVDWFNTIYDFNRDQKFKTLLLKAAILSIPEVTNIVRLEVVPPGSDGQAKVDVEIDSIYSDEPLKVNP